MPESAILSASDGEHSRGPGQAPVEILIVDDNPSKAMAIESVLAPIGETLVMATSGREALHYLLTRDFATVILDVNMPDLDGFETARMIRSRRRSASTPIIFVTAVNMDEADEFQGYSLGAVDYICAPIVPEVLRAKVSVFVQLHRQTENARRQAQRLKEQARELEQSQRELRLSERMASIGTLCAGLGHDMGNLLFPVGVWLDRLDPDDLPPENRDGVESLRSCVQYMRRLVSGLRLVSLDPSNEGGTTVVQLGPWVDEIGPILRNAIPRLVNLEIDIDGNLPGVRIAPHRLAQAVFNLVQNAGEVLRDRQDGVVRLWAARDGGGIRIGVSDNGPGMSDQVLAHCMEPFFTTKSRGLTTGLGLSLVHGIAQSAGGTLDVKSSPQSGSTFSFRLPIADQEQTLQVSIVVTIANPRDRAIAVSLANVAGFQVIERDPAMLDGAGVWLTDSLDDLAKRIPAFTGMRSDREVFVLTNQLVEMEGARVTSLTGPNGLARQLNAFRARLQSGTLQTIEPVGPR